MSNKSPNMFEHNGLNHTSDCMLRLKQSLETIISAIPIGSRVALIDEPVHRNVGDHLIHLGITQFFREHDISITARAHTYSYHHRWLGRRVTRDTVLVCCGGGHLGDLYPAHQTLREQLVRDFPRNRIVVLPQSLYFEDKDRMRLAGDIFRDHPDFHLFLRDQDSRQRAEALGLDKLYLAPDMAHALYPIRTESRVPEPQGGRLYLLRQDREGADQAKSRATETGASDWSDIVRLPDTLALAGLAAAFRALRGVGSLKVLETLLDRRRAVLVERGITLLAGYEEIVTSRLHGALLGLLMGKQVRMLPSLTGKAEAYHATWLKDHAGCEYGSRGLGRRARQ